MSMNQNDVQPRDEKRCMPEPTDLVWLMPVIQYYELPIAVWTITMVKDKIKLINV